jgi:molybdopterin converting factor small subunit
VGVLDGVRRLLGAERGAVVRVHVLLRGRIGPRWYDVDRKLELPAGTTLGELVAKGDALGIPLEEAVRESPHLRDTLMLNGERCPLATESNRPLVDGDEIYLLSPLAGG